MIKWMIIFFILAAFASVLGFGNVAGTFASIAQFLAVIFIILFVASMVYALLSNKKQPPLM